MRRASFENGLYWALYVWGLCAWLRLDAGRLSLGLWELGRLL